MTTSLALNKSELKSLVAVRAWHVPARIATITALYALGAAIVAQPRFCLLAFVICPFLGFLLAGALNAAHDCIHGTHVVWRHANRWLGMIWCTPTLINFSSYRANHLVHHRLTGQPGDTEPSFKFKRVAQYARFMSGIDYWRAIAPSIAENFRRRRKIRPDVELDNQFIVAWLLLMIAWTCFSPLAAVLGYWIPLLLYPPTLMFFSLPEHYECEAGSDLRTNTRSIASNFFVRFFFWNAGWHAEHHAYPMVPAVNLSRLHRRVGDELTHGKSYVAFHYTVARTLRRKGTL